MEYHFSDRISNVRPSAIREILKYAASHPEVIALSTGSPANEAVPVEEISEISARIFKEKPLAGLQYSMTEGVSAPACVYEGAAEEGIRHWPRL